MSTNVTEAAGPGSIAMAEGALYTWKPPHNGVCYHRSRVKIKDVTDGTSKTYMVGEKFQKPASYEGITGANVSDPGYDYGDNESMYSGYNRDQHRTTVVPPLQDRVGIADDGFSFGSAHPSAFGMCFADGSVRRISYDIDPTAHRWLGVVDDGNVTGDF